MINKPKTKKSIQNKINPMVKNLLDFSKKNNNKKSIVFHEDFELESRKHFANLKR